MSDGHHGESRLADGKVADVQWLPAPGKKIRGSGLLLLRNVLLRGVLVRGVLVRYEGLHRRDVISEISFPVRYFITIKPHYFIAS